MIPLRMYNHSLKVAKMNGKRYLKSEILFYVHA